MKVLFKVNRIYRIFARVVKSLTATVAGLFVLAFLLIQIPGVQNYIGQRVLSALSDELDTRITANDVSFNFHEIGLERIHFHDQEGDTLFSSQSLAVSYNLLPILNQTISINAITLNDGSIRAHRKAGEKAFNYQFLLDYLAPSDTTSSGGNQWAVDVSEVRLNNTTIVHRDEVTDQDFRLQTPHLAVDVDRLDLDNQIVELDQLTIEGTNLAYRFKGSTPKIAGNSNKSISFPNPIGWNIKINKLNIHHTSLAYVDENAKSVKGKLNPNNLKVEDFTLQGDGFSLQEDTAFGHIHSFKFAEQSGLRLDTFSGDLQLSPTLMRLDNLELQTDQSRISKTFELQFDDIADLSDFVRKVNFKAHFDDAKIAASDLLYFIDDTQLPKQTYFLDGEISGKVSNLKGDDIRLRYGDHTDFLGNFSILGLPDASQAYIDFKVDRLQTNYQELNSLLTFANLPSNTRKLGVVNFNGTFNGFLSDFVAYGNLKTALGSLESDINMKIPKNGEPSYSGNLKVYNFHAGRYLDDPNLGRVTFSADLKGEGMKQESMVANADGIIQKLEYFNYAYKDIEFNGKLQQRFFSGDFNIKDPNLIMDFHGTVDFKSEVPVFSVVTNIKHIETKRLNLTEQNIRGSTNITADFEGITIDDAVGNLKLKNTNVYTGGSFYRVGDVILNSENYELGKRLYLESSIVDARLDGNFDVTQLPSTFLGFFSNYYPSVLNYSTAYTSGQDFMFSLDIKKTNNITDLLLYGIKGVAGTNISGNFNSNHRRIIVNANIPALEYQNFKARDISLFMNSNDDTLYFDTDVQDFAFSKDLHASHHIKGKVYNNNIFVNLKVFEDSLVNNLLANAILTNVGDSIKVKLLDSRMEIAGKEWKINSSNALYFYRDLIYADDLEFETEEQKIVVESTFGPMDDQQNTGLQANLTKVNLKHLMDILGFDDFELDGAIDGQLAFYDIFSNDRSLDSDISIADFSIDRDTFGMFNAKANIDFANMDMQLDAGLDGKVGQFNANGNVNFNSQALQLDVNAENAPFKLLEPFMTDILSEMEGRINGQVAINGTLDNPQMKGNLQVNNGVAKVVYLNSKYYFEPMDIDFTEKSIYIKNTRFRDGITASASTADIGGEIYMKDFSNIEFRDFYIYTDHNFKFMETTKKDNDLFYGTAYGKGIMLINGPISRLDVYINAVSDPGTKVNIPIVYETGVSQYDFVTFVDRDSSGKVVSKLEDQLSYAGVNFTMDLDVTQDAQVRMIFDEQAGDVIEGRGEGSLKMNFNTDGDFEMYGSINIIEGDYLFTLQDVIKKKFTVERGGSITWAGDPYEANLNLTANYTKKVSAYNLVSYMEDQLSSSEKQQLREPTPYTVELNMTGSLSNPNIDFDIEADESNESVSSIVSNRLKEIKNDQNELNKQVFGLIVFNSFLPAQLGSSQSSGTLLSSGVGTVTEFVSNQLSIYFNDWLSKYDMEVDFQYRNYNIGSTGGAEGIKRNELELELRKKIGRLAINVGGNFDFGNTNGSVSNTNNLAGDFSVEYSLTEDGRFRVRGFRNSEYDLFSDAYRNKGGIGLYYRKEFNSFKELFQSPQSSQDKSSSDEESEPKLEAVDGLEGGE